MKSKLPKINFGIAENKKQEHGFSLLEVMVAMIIFMVITASIFGLMQAGRVSRNRSNTRTDMLKNARVAIHLMGRDALNAGLGYNKKGAIVPDDFISTRFKNPVDTDEVRDVLSSIVGGNDLLTNNLITNSTDKTDTIVFTFRDMDFNGGDVISLKSVENPTNDAATPRVITSTANGAASVNKNDLYLLESSTSQIALMVTATNNANQIDFKYGDPLGLNQKLNGVGKEKSLLKPCATLTEENCTTYGGENFASLKRFFLVSYKVKDDGTLVRITYGNDKSPTAEQIVEQPLAYNVENLQIKYVLEDGTVTDNPGAGPDGKINTADDDPRRFNLVRQLTISIKVQSTEIDETTRKPETVTLNATFSTRNLEYDAG